MVIIKSKMKLIALFVLGMSVGSLVVHLSITKFSGMGLEQYSSMDGLRHDFDSVLGPQQSRNKKLWGDVKSLEPLQPYANPRINHPGKGFSSSFVKFIYFALASTTHLQLIFYFSTAPNENNNGFIYAKVFGGFEKIRSSICDLVTISRLLNATLVIPEIQESLRSKGVSYKFKSFSYLYDEEQFIASLTSDVIIVKSLPENLKEARKRNEFPIFKPKSSTSPNYYIQEILPKLKKDKVIGLILTDGGCLQVGSSILLISFVFNFYLSTMNWNPFLWEVSLMSLVSLVESPLLKGNLSSNICMYRLFILGSKHSYALCTKEIKESCKNNSSSLQSILPPSMSELQRLRCRVSFHALQFRSEIQILGRRMVGRLRAWGQPFLAYHPGLLRDTLAYHGCAELFQYSVEDSATEYLRENESTYSFRAQMIKQGIVNEKLSIESHLRRENGSCPLMPEEVGLVLRAMGYPPKTIIYLAGSETFGGQRVLIPLRGMFSNLVDSTSLCSKKELSDLVGPETSLPEDLYHPPPSKSEKQLKEEWNKAGPRPRPLPPPPDRPIYRHEKEGWYGWITETDKEPNPSAMNLRMQAHRLLWDALDYIISVEADAFFPGFHNDGSRWPDFASLVMGQRLYESPSSRTYRPDREVVAKLFNITRENMYHPKHNWTLSVKDHLNKSLGEDGLIRQSLFSKPVSFLSHPFPECSCRTLSVKVPDQLKSNDGRILYGGEDECPTWMKRSQEAGSVEATDGRNNDSDLAEYESDTTELPESDDDGSKSSTALPFDRDDEWDPND
ncbi:hypothetical protein EZV62_007630 [Acer yangbiense]|uniref:O-fucosyltransferase family protein n=1 Tax=Acer yangbiense TaxID=1000413 RepID=A0A5C7IAT8_9ROSI|nr:hypothetical protein EZV62_007630 [Acer yangbiense]